MAVAAPFRLPEALQAKGLGDAAPDAEPLVSDTLF
jgi:hypothetical protein